ncbi:hypothetical protein [Rhizobium oryzicola]|uniref:Phage protein n=1 Tax=Rhizobium oryzicola TaxID=1232668 RepID=A0ABT8SVS5_9HYPH|nr:hypothetical protein [Rhizobium oryzicola]MDO1582395.1 hypothetical protein [Rhizobium oryzicola]
MTTNQNSAPKLTLAQMVVRAIHELGDTPDPALSDTLMVKVGDLEAIVDNRLEHWLLTVYDFWPKKQKPGCCPICDEPFKSDDLCATDISEGTCHAACLEGSSIVDLDAGEDMPDDKIDTYPYSEVMEPTSSQSWIRWQGGEMPVPEGTAVEVILRYGKQAQAQAGSGYATRWSYDSRHGDHDDIVFYRLTNPTPSSQMTVDRVSIAETIYSAYGYEPSDKSVLAGGTPYHEWAKALRAADAVIAACHSPQTHVLPSANEIDDLIEHLLDAQQDINLSANETMSQPLCDASALIDEVEKMLRRVRVLSTAPEPQEQMTADRVSIAETIYSAYGYEPSAKTLLSDGTPYHEWAKALRAADAVIAACHSPQTHLEGEQYD